MIDEEIKIKIANKHGVLNFNYLLEFMSSSGIKFINRRLKDTLGIATYYCIYLDMEKIDTYPNTLLFFIILHEMAHYKRINKMGKDIMLKNLSSDNFDEIFKHVINEEIFADRYACFIFNLFNKCEFPRSATQCLNELEKQIPYKETVMSIFGKIKNNEENYKNLVNSFLI